jgi:hypothetical protein
MYVRKRGIRERNRENERKLSYVPHALVAPHTLV